MRRFDRADILAARDDQRDLEALRRAYICAELGEVAALRGLHLAFEAANGECHVKAASGQKSPFFVVKIACGFYDNSSLGLPNSDGAYILGCARSGRLLACIEDGGWLTDLRTALTGLLAAEALLAAAPRRIGIVGSGAQGQLHAQLMAQRWPEATIKLWGRSRAGRDGAIISLMERGITAHPVLSAEQACADADLIVTATPSRRPIICADWVPRAATIVAVGSDGPGKQELDPRLFVNASEVVVDMALDLDGGREVAHAVAQKLISADEVKSLGQCLASRGRGRDVGQARRIADLTGSAVADLAICSAFFLQATEAADSSPAPMEGSA